MTEFETTLQNFFNSNKDLAPEFMHGDHYEFVQDDHPELTDVKFDLKDNYGGEDMGAEYYSVWQFTKGSEVVFIRFDGYYSSYNGADYQDFKFVKPQLVERIEYV